MTSESLALTLVNPSYVKILKKARLKSDQKIKVSAMLEQGGRILAVSYNKSGSSRKGYYEYSRHAEDRLVRTASNANSATVYVYREHAGSKEGRLLLLAKPCRLCRKQMVEAGIKTVVYSSPEGWVKAKL